MRILVLPASGTSHVMGVIPLCQGLRAAGHDVLFAGTGGLDVAVRAGLHAVDVAPDIDLGPVFARHADAHEAFTARQRAGTATDAENVALAARVFSDVARVLAPAVCDLARQWRPDLVLYTPMQGCGPLAAAAAGVPAVEQMDGVTGGPALRSEMAGGLAAEYERYAPRGAPDVVDLDVLPASLRAGPVNAWPMRPVPYTGGRRLPAWMFQPPGRRRIVVTFGTVLPHSGGLGALSTLVESMAEADASFLVALGGGRPDVIPAPPPNVTVYSWLPVDVLASGCAALIHHGGQMSMLTAAYFGVPQLMLPHDSDQFENGEAVRRRGAGLVATLDTVTAGLIDTVATDAALRRASVELAAEIQGMPSPADTARRLTHEVASRRPARR
jgi:UDP:flavonoid glycosyltransferase YjiC (YdhE family)